MMPSKILKSSKSLVSNYIPNYDDELNSLKDKFNYDIQNVSESIEVKDFEKKIDNKVETARFRGNFYIEGIEAWEERNWLNKINPNIVAHISRT